MIIVGFGPLCLRHDLKAFENWKVRCTDRDAATYHAELQHRSDRKSEAQRQAAGLFEASGPIEVSKGAGEDLTTVKSALTKIRNHFQAPMSELYIVVICKWSSPSLVSSASQKTQSALLGALPNFKPLALELWEGAAVQSGQMKEIKGDMSFIDRIDIQNSIIVVEIERPRNEQQ